MASKVNVDKIARGSGTPEFTIPTADGTAKSALITDGSGVLSFATGTPSSSNFLRGDGTWQTVTTTALTGSTNTWIPTITGANALTGTGNFTYDGNTLSVLNSGTASSIKLFCESSNQHYQEIKAAPHAGSANWTLTLPPNDGDANQFLQTDGGGATTWATAGGLANASIWRLTTDFTNNASPIASNWEAADTYGAGILGSPMTEASGIFTFPSTGMWYIMFNASFFGGSTNYPWNHSYLDVTTDNSSYNTVGLGAGNMDNAASAGNTYAQATSWTIFDVTDTALCKCRFSVTSSGTQYTTWRGNSSSNRTFALFMKLGDT